MIWFIKGNLYYITGIYSALQGIKLRYRKTDFITGTQGGGCRPPIDLIVDFHIIPPLSLKRIINDKNNPSIDIFYFISSYRVLLIFEDRFLLLRVYLYSFFLLFLPKMHFV
jgi:hypothetical protein